MEPPPIQSSEIDLSSSPISPSVASITIPALSPPGDDNQSLNSPKQLEQMQNSTTQNPSSPRAESDPLQIPQPQAPESKHPDPPNPEPESVDHDLHQPEPEDPEDQEGTIHSPSHQPLPSMSASRRAPSRRGRRGVPKNAYSYRKKLAALEKKSQDLAKNLKSVPFVPSKALDFSRHEEHLKRLGLWDFAHLEFDRKIRVDLIAKLIVYYDEKKRCSHIDDVRIRVNQADLARALNLPSKKPVDCGEEDWPGDFISFMDEFVSCWMLLHEDTWMLPTEVRNWTGMIKEGHPEKVDWGKLIWFMVKKEISKGAQLENCYYASHLQHLIKWQKEGFLKEEKSSDEVKEIMVVKDDEEDDVDVKMVECDEVSHGGEPEINLENAQPSVEGIASAQSDLKMEENVDSTGLMGKVGDAENVDSLGHGDVATDGGALVENQKTAGDEVENSKSTGDQVENLKSTGDHVENLEIAVDHVENVETTVVDHVENVETTVVDHVENVEATDVDHVENLETVVDHVENVENAGDHVENVENAGDHAENVENTGDHVENLKMDTDHVENTGDHVENLKMDTDHVENMPTAVDDVENMNIGEDMKIDGCHVEDEEKVSGDVMEDVKPEPNVVIPDDAEIQETGCNDLIDFEDCKVDESDPWDLSRKDSDQDHFLRHCNSMSEAKVNENQTNSQQPEVVEDDEEPEDDEHVQGFDLLQKCNSFNGLSSGHLMQTIESSQNPYAAPDFDNHHMMLGGPSSIFGNSTKRELDLDPEISLNESHKRMRNEGPPDLDFCFDQMQQWMEKSRMAYMSSQQTMVSQQQMLFNELGSKDQLIQQLKLTNDELQRRRQSEIARYENELYTMSSVIDDYRKALRKTQEAFAEYRKSSSLAPEPLYKDAGKGGVVKCVAELERERLVREKEEVAAKIMVERFEEEWKMKFEGHVEEVEKFGVRVCEIEKGVKLLKESVGKRKASEKVG